MSGAIAHTTASLISLNGVLIAICDLFAAPVSIFHGSLFGYLKYSMFMLVKGGHESSEVSTSAEVRKFVCYCAFLCQMLTLLYTCICWMFVSHWAFSEVHGTDSHYHYNVVCRPLSKSLAPGLERLHLLWINLKMWYLCRECSNVYRKDASLLAGHHLQWFCALVVNSLHPIAAKCAREISWP